MGTKNKGFFSMSKIKAPLSKNQTRRERRYSFERYLKAGSSPLSAHALFLFGGDNK